MLILGIETSCDETAAAVVLDGVKVLSNVVASQIKDHSKFGGIVPEIASRKHVEAIGLVIKEALDAAHVTLQNIEGIAVTRGPGLIGSLLVGLSTAKALAYTCKIPLVGVNHLEGHIAAIYLTERYPEFPYIALVVSGGHTVLLLVSDFQNITILGQTRDDAAGEAFDKAAKFLNIGYPGGIIIDKLSKKGNRKAITFPKAMRDSLDFSFSGLKTALINMVKKRESFPGEEEIPDIVASFQEAIVDVLVEKTLRAAEQTSVDRIVVCGGVAANSRLRELFTQEASCKGKEIFIPPPILCTDNAAMIAALGEYLFRRGQRDSLDINALSRWPLNLQP